MKDSRPRSPLVRYLTTLAQQRSWSILTYGESIALRRECAECEIRVTCDDGQTWLLRGRQSRINPAFHMTLECDAEARALSESTCIHLAAVPLIFPRRETSGHVFTAVLTEDLAGGTLRGLCERPGTLSAGTVTTILVGVCSALTELARHEWGVPMLSLDTVSFRGDGCPVVNRLPGIERHGPSHPRHDAHDLLEFAQILARSLPEDANRSLVAALRGSSHDPEWYRRVTSELVALADPARVVIPTRRDDQRVSAVLDEPGRQNWLGGALSTLGSRCRRFPRLFWGVAAGTVIVVSAIVAMT